MKVKCLPILPIEEEGRGKKKTVKAVYSGMSQDGTNSDSDEIICTSRFPIENRRCHPWYTHKTPKDHVQLKVDDILEMLPTIKPKDAFCLVGLLYLLLLTWQLGVTMYDLYDGDDDAFVVGMAGRGRVGMRVDISY